MFDSDTRTGPGGTAVMTYDYTGIRVKKSGTSGTTLFPFTGYEFQSGTVTKFIRIGNEIIASKQGTSTKRFYHNDHLGGVNIISDINGNQAQLTEYDPWGKVSRMGDVADLTHRFTGQELDSESDIHYYGGRYYDQGLGRFVSPDPFVQSPDDPQNLNRYSYVLNSPQNYIDPSGYEALREESIELIKFAGPSSTNAGFDYSYSGSTGSAAGSVFTTTGWSGSTLSNFQGFEVSTSGTLGGITFGAGSVSSSPGLPQGDSTLAQLTGLGAGIGTGAVVGTGVGYALAGLSVVCPVCGLAVGVGAIGYTGYKLYQDYLTGFAGIQSFANSVENVLSVNATAGEAFGVGFAAGGLASSISGAGTGIWHAKLGHEIPLSKTPGMIERIAPFGNRTNHAYGRFTHYHRRVPDPASPRDSLPGQSLKRHRPFEPKSPDTSFWDRF